MVQESGQVSETKIQQCEIVPTLTNMSEQMSDVSEPDQIKYKQLTYCDLHVLPEECDFTQTGNVKHWSHLAIFLVCCFLCLSLNVSYVHVFLPESLMAKQI